MESASGDKTNKRKDCMTMIKRGSWKQEEDLLLKNYIETHGEGKWTTVSKRSGLMRGAKSCRMRWKNHLRPNIKHGQISQDEEDLIIRMHKLLGNRWSLIAGRLPGRTDNEIKNYWNTHLSKQKLGQHHRSQSMKPTCLKSKKRNPRSTKINNNPNPTSTGSTISLGERVAVKATVDTNVIYRQDIEQDKVRQDDIKPKYSREIHDDITINEINESYVTQTSLMPAHSVECKSMNYWEDIDTFSWWPVWENIEFYEPFLPSLEEYSSVQSTGFTS